VIFWDLISFHICKKINTMPKKKSILQNLNEAVYFQAAQSYSIVVWANNNTLIKSRPMKKYIPSLEAIGWCRIHKSYMVNPEFIGHISADRNSISLLNGKSLPISRRLRKNVLAWRSNLF
jgi:two-component system LytT family response regulator